jgi:hypothetical protein
MWNNKTIATVKIKRFGLLASGRIPVKRMLLTSLLLKPGKYRLKKLSCTFFVSGHAKKMCRKSSSGTGIVPLIE